MNREEIEREYQKLQNAVVDSNKKTNNKVNKSISLISLIHLTLAIFLVTTGTYKLASVFQATTPEEELWMLCYFSAGMMLMWFNGHVVGHHTALRASMRMISDVVLHIGKIAYEGVKK